ncbi:MAG: hypothetical protein M3198_14930 [Actinomycetota bacterium]|nr:hypothetical protein [Actinomycetota bacterium]
MAEVQDEIEQLLGAASPEVRAVLAQVYEIEKEKLYMSLPQGVVEDIAEAIRRVVK